MKSTRHNWRSSLEGLVLFGPFLIVGAVLIVGVCRLIALCTGVPK